MNKLYQIMHVNNIYDVYTLKVEKNNMLRIGEK
jgi:hypothetical protein